MTKVGFLIATTALLAGIVCLLMEYFITTLVLAMVALIVLGIEKERIKE